MDRKEYRNMCQQEMLSFINAFFVSLGKLENKYLLNIGELLPIGSSLFIFAKKV